MMSSIAKYPVEIELTDFCSLKCICCVNSSFKNKGYLKKSDFVNILDYLYVSKDILLFINLSGIGDIFIHPEFEKFIDIFIDKFKGTGIKLLIPTKGILVGDKEINIFKKILSNGILLNISVGIYSIREKVHNRISGLDCFEKTIFFVKKLKKENIPFSMELLVGDYNIEEKEYFVKFCKKLQVGYIFQKYHNFSGEVDLFYKNDYKYVQCSFGNENNNGFNVIPFFDSKGFVYSCSNSGKKNNFLLGDIDSILKKYDKLSNLANYIGKEYCQKNRCKSCFI